MTRRGSVCIPAAQPVERSQALAAFLVFSALTASARSISVGSWMPPHITLHSQPGFPVLRTPVTHRWFPLSAYTGRGTGGEACA
jgi:hypothetical protein